MNKDAAEALIQRNTDEIEKAVTSAADQSEAQDEVQKIIVHAQHSTAAELRKVIDAAKAGDQRAINKLSVFERVKDPDVAARLAIMNRAQRQQYLGGMKAVAKAAKRRRRRAAERAATK